MWWVVALVVVAIVVAVALFLKQNYNKDTQSILDEEEEDTIYEVDLPELNAYTELKERMEDGDDTITHADLMKSMLKRAKALFRQATKLTPHASKVQAARKAGVCSQVTWESWQSANQLINIEHQNIQAEAEDLKLGWGKGVMKMAASHSHLEHRRRIQRAKLIERASKKQTEGKIGKGRAKSSARKKEGNKEAKQKKKADKMFNDLCRDADRDEKRNGKKKKKSQKRKPKAD